MANDVTMEMLTLMARPQRKTARTRDPQPGSCRMGRLWLLLLLLLPGMGRAEQATGHPALASGAQLPPWQILPRWTCVMPLVECSRFYPSQGSPKTTPSGAAASGPSPASPSGQTLTQSWSSPVPLMGDGRLEVAPGELILQAPDGGQVHLTGPGTFYLTRGQLIPLAQMDGRYRHTSSEKLSTRASAARTPILVPPLVAGPDGTVVDFVMTREGHIALQVLEGRIHVEWLDEWSEVRAASKSNASTANDTALAEGEGLVLEPSGLNGRTWYRLDADAAREHLAHLRRVLHSQTKGGSRGGPSSESLTPEQAHAEFLRALPTLSATEVEAGLTWLLKGRSDPNLTPRVLYFAWLKLRAESHSAAQARVAEMLLTRYPASPWGQMMGADERQPPAKSPDQHVPYVNPPRPLE